jgi:rod shape-determining protein MreB
MVRLGADLGIDLGTATIIVYLRGQGIVLCEPSVVAMDTATRRVLAVGEQARQMLGRTPESITAVRPLQEGVIADYTITLKLLQYLLARVCGPMRRLLRPRMIICVPSGCTNVERRAALQAAYEAGAKKAVTIAEPMAAAIGAGLPIASPGGNMVVDVGGGTTDIAVISLGGIVVQDSVRIAGNNMDQAIVRHVRRAHNLHIGEATAEEIKLKIGSAYPLEPELEMEVRGRDLISGLPKTVTVSSTEIREALAEPVSHLVERVKAVLGATPPELAADIILRGITLTGGGVLLRGFDRLIEHETKIATRVAENPLYCVAEGTGRALDEIDALEAQSGGRTRPYYSID